MPRVWPLTGRDQELAVIDAALRPGSRARGLVLAGGAGVGKTRLAREALALAARRGATTHWAYATASSRGIPLGAFAELVEAPGSEPGDALGRAVEALARIPRRAGLVVGVDDVHLLDELSAVLVHRLVMHGVATVVLTLRQGEPVQDAVRALWKDEHVRRIDLAPLTEEALADLVTQALGGPVDGSAISRLWALTRGNALFLRHLVEGEAAAGRLHPVDGLWCWQPAEVRIPPVLAEIVGELMGSVSDDVRNVVDLLALGEPLAPELLAGLVGPEAVEEADSARLIRVDGDRTEPLARLAHPLYGEVRRSVLGTLRARRLRRLLATTLPTGKDATTELRRAVLTLDSDLPADAALFLSASRHAIRLFDLVLAERLARAAVDAGGGPEAELALAMSLSWLSRGEETEAILARLPDTGTPGGTRRIAAATRIGNLLWTLGRPAEAEAVLVEALAGSSDELERDLLLAFRATLEGAAGHGRRALADGSRLLFPAPRDDHVAVMAASAVVAGAAVVGDLDVLRRAAALGDAAGQRALISIPRLGLGDFSVLGLRLAGEIGAAVEAALSLQAASRDVPGPAHLMGLVLRGHAEVARGRVRTAERFLREAWVGLRPSSHEFRFRCRTLLALALAMSGDPTARQFVVRPGSGHPAYALLLPDDVLALAWVEAAEGATSAAVALAHDAVELARDQDSPAFEVLALQTAVHFGDGAVADRLDELAGVVDGPRAATASAHARALADGTGDGLVSVSERWESIGDVLAAADAAAQAALALSRAGRTGSATAAAARAYRLGIACEGPRTPAMRAAARPLPLTEREREIATLAADGLTNRDIAARLVLSVRTVEGHLYRAGHKLGFSDRAALRAVLRDGRME